MYYHRALDDEFFNLLKNGGPLRSLIDLTREKWQGRDVYLDLQFRGDTISFYAGLTTLLQIRRDKKGNLRPRAAAAYRLREHGVRALYRPGEFSDLVCHARQYLERVEVRKRYLSGEGLCQNWLSYRYGQRRRTGCGEPVAIDREVVVGYTDTAEQDLLWDKPIRKEALGLLEQISKANPELYGRNLHKHPLGDELDLLMWEPPGTFLLAEVKGRKNVHGIYMAPIQVTAYTMVWKRFAEPKSLADLERLVDQKRELGLIAMDDDEWQSFEASLCSPEFVPALVVERPNRASSCWKRLGEVIKHTSDHWPAGWGTPFVDSLRIYAACDSEDGWTDVTDDFREWGRA